MREGRDDHATQLAWCGWYVAAWMSYGFFFFTKTLVMRRFWLGPFDWRQLLAAWMTHAFAWLMIAPVVFWLSERLPIGRSTRLARVPVHLALSVGIGTLVAAVVAFIAPQPTPSAHGQLVRTSKAGEVAATLNQNVLAYWLVLIVQHAYQYHRRYRRREWESGQLEIQSSALRARVVEAELANARAQLQPRAVFDVLEAISRAAASNERVRAEQLIGRLGDFLGEMLEDLDTPVVPLAREVERLELLLDLERIRIDRPLALHVASDSDALDMPVPCRLLQQLVAGVISEDGWGGRALGELTITVTAGEGPMLRITARHRATGNAANPSAERFEAVRAHLNQELKGLAGVTVACDPDGTLVVDARLWAAEPPVVPVDFRGATTAVGAL